MALAFVNSATGTGDGSSTTIAAGAANHTTGNLITVQVIWSSAAGTLNSIADTAGNTYTRDASSKIDTGSDNAETFHAENATGNAANVVTATFSTGVTFRRIMVHQYSGAATASALDQVGIGSASATQTVTSASFTTTQADEVIVSAAGSSVGETWDAGAAGTIRTSSVGGDSGSEDQIVSSIASYTGSMHGDSAGNLWITTTTYKAAASATVVPPHILVVDSAVAHAANY